MRGLSQERLAELAVTSGKQISEIERGLTNVGLDTLARIAAALSVDAADFFTRQDRRRPDAAVFLSRDDADRIIDLGERLKKSRAPKSSPPVD
jgi:transcriptional regulator with XRE-family HTH domain